MFFWGFFFFFKENKCLKPILNSTFGMICVCDSRPLVPPYGFFFSNKEKKVNTFRDGRVQHGWLITFCINGVIANNKNLRLDGTTNIYCLVNLQPPPPHRRRIQYNLITARVRLWPRCVRLTCSAADVRRLWKRPQLLSYPADGNGSMRYRKQTKKFHAHSPLA